VEITLKNGTPAEVRTRLVLHALLEKYDMTGWIFTNRVVVDETARPHSHPVLTLNTQNEHNEAMCLAELVHEQLHWFEEAHAERRDRAIDETSQYYAEVPSARPEGAGSESSTRLHLLVCYFEYQAMKCLLGAHAARQTMVALSQHHYCWIYRTVLEDERKICGIVQRHDLLPEPLRRRDTSSAGGSH